MTIKQFLIESEKRMMNRRLESLKKIKAPSVVIESLANYIAEIETSWKAGGDTELLEVEFENFVQKKGNKGKPYISFNNGTINYFPMARYGKYVKSAN